MRTFQRAFLLAIAGIVAVVAVNALGAQAPGTNTTPPAFEVASVKPNHTIGGPRAFDLHGDRLTATNRAAAVPLIKTRSLRAPIARTPQSEENPTSAMQLSCSARPGGKPI